jgi:hypothetical protein
MYTENGLMLDLNEVRKVVDAADVFGIGFRLFGERLFVDTRSNSVDGPFIAAVPPLSSVQERMFWLGQNRPRFGMPQRFAFFFWPGSLRYFVESGVWEAIRRRVLESGHPAAAADADRALAELRRLERQAILDAITGENYRTLWQSESSRRSG